MKKIYLCLVLLLGMLGTSQASAEKIMVATSEGTAAATLDELATLAENGTPVMLWNNGRSRYVQNTTKNSDGSQILLLYTQFTAGDVSTSSFLWKLEKADGENSYKLVSLVDNKYMYMANASPALCSMISADDTEKTPETFTFGVIDADNQTFNLKADNVSAAAGSDMYLNGNGLESGHDGATVVGWSNGTGGNSAYKIMVPETSEKDLYTIRYNLKFFDGSSDQTLEDAGLATLIPSEAAEGYIEVQAVVGDSVALPTFANNTLRSVYKGDAQFTDTTYFFLKAEDVAGGSLELNANYTSDPQITFNCSIDLESIDGVDGDYWFPGSSESTDVLTARYAVGDTIKAPAVANFTALTGYNDETAQTSKELDAVYRPWRTIYAACYSIVEGGEPALIRNVTLYVDLDSTLTAPDMGQTYVFNAEYTSEQYGMDFPLVVDKDNIYNQMEIQFYYDQKIPVKLSEVSEDGQVNEETATWYILRFRDSKVLTNEPNDNGMLVMNSSATIDDNVLWCFAKSSDGTGAYLLYNKAKPGYVLCEDGMGYPVLVEAAGGETGFDFVSIAGGYGLRVSATAGSENNALNDFQNITPGQLGYWDDERAWTDAGSKVTFEEYSAANYTFLRGRAYLNSENAINGYTADQLKELKKMIEDGDTEMEVESEYSCDELDAIAESERVQYDETHAYAIVSAVPAYIQRNNVKMALYVKDDTLLAWKEFNEKDRSFYFQLKDKEVLQKADASGDSIVYALYNIGTDSYVSGNFVYAGKVKMTKDYSKDMDRFHIWAQEEVTDADGNVTFAHIPAGFFIDRYKLEDVDDPKSSMVNVTLSMHAGSVDKSTEGTTTSYNMRGTSYSTVYRFIDYGDPTTVGINSVTTDTDAAAEGAIYDLSGRRVTKAVKGIYIQNGKKVLVK